MKSGRLGPRCLCPLAAALPGKRRREAGGRPGRAGGRAACERAARRAGEGSARAVPPVIGVFRPHLRVADMTAAGRSPLEPLLETWEDRSVSPGEQTDAYLTLTR